MLRRQKNRRLAAGVLLAALAALGCGRGVHPRLEALVREDEADGAQHGLGAKQLYEREERRLAEAQRYADQGKLLAPADEYLAARIFIHGHAPEQYRLAHELAKKAADGGVGDARFLAASAQDRYRMSLDRPQLYGTQFEYNPAARKWTLYPVDPAVTDEERAYWDVRPLSESKKLLDELNRQGLSQFEAGLRRRRQAEWLSAVRFSTMSRKN